MSIKTYILLRRLNQFIIPVIASLYYICTFFADLPSAVTILGSLALISLFIGMLLLSKLPHDGQMVITTNEAGIKVFSLELDKDPEDLEGQEYVSFKITDKRSEDYDSQG